MGPRGLKYVAVIPKNLLKNVGSVSFNMFVESDRVRHPFFPFEIFIIIFYNIFLKQFFHSVYIGTIPRFVTGKKLDNWDS